MEASPLVQERVRERAQVTRLWMGPQSAARLLHPLMLLLRRPSTSLSDRSLIVVAAHKVYMPNTFIGASFEDVQGLYPPLPHARTSFGGGGIAGSTRAPPTTAPVGIGRGATVMISTAPFS